MIMASRALTLSFYPFTVQITKRWRVAQIGWEATLCDLYIRINQSELDPVVYASALYFEELVPHRNESSSTRYQMMYEGFVEWNKPAIRMIKSRYFERLKTTPHDLEYHMQCVFDDEFQNYNPFMMVRTLQQEAWRRNVVSKAMIETYEANPDWLFQFS